MLDRTSSNYDDVWSRLDYTIFDSTTCVNNSTDSRLAEPLDNKPSDSSAEKCVLDVSSEKAIGQSAPAQNNHQNTSTVIKIENSKNQEISDDQTEKASPCGEKLGIVNNQKLDDFEQLLDSASASSNIINKKLVCRNSSDISDDSFALKSSLSHNELLSNNFSAGLLNSFNCEASSSGVSSTNGSLFTVGVSMSSTVETIPVEANKTTTEDYDDDEIIKSESTTCSSQADDFYLNFIDEIRSDWLHFRPKTPSTPSSFADDVQFESDLTDNAKKFAVELQILDDRYKETEAISHTNNIYLSQPMSFNTCNKYIQLNDDEMQESVFNVKTEPADRDYVFMEESNKRVDDSSTKQIVEQEAIKSLLEKYRNDIAKDDSLSLDVDDIMFDERYTKSIGCSNFKLFSDDLKKNFLPSRTEAQSKQNDVFGANIKNEAPDYPSELSLSSVQNISVAKEAPIAELQSHNYVLQYGSPVTSNTVTLNSLPPSTNILSCSSQMDSGIPPATTLFQQQFINSGNTIISTTQQSQQSKLQPIVYDSNTIVLAATAQRKQVNGPSDRNRKCFTDESNQAKPDSNFSLFLVNQSKFKQVFMLDLTQGQDKRKSIGDNVIKKTYADLGIGSQNILVSSVNSNLLQSNSNNLTQPSQTQQFSLVHQNALQKPIILSTSTAAGGAGTLIQSSQTSSTGNKIIVTPAPQLAGNVYVSTHGKLVIPSSNNSQSIILDSSKMISTNNQLQTQQKLQSSHRVKLENKMNMLLENSAEKNVIYAKYNKNKLLQTVANIIPMQATAAGNKSGVTTQSQVIKQIPPITSSSQQQSIGIISNNKTIQRIQQQQQQILRPQYGSTSVNFQNSPTSSKIIQQPNNGNNILGSVNNNNNDNSTTPR